MRRRTPPRPLSLLAPRLLAATLLLTACSDATQAVDATPPPGGPPGEPLRISGRFHDSPFGINVSYANDTLIANRPLDLARAAGVGWVRLNFEWSAFQPVGPLTSRGWRLAMRMAVDAARSRGMRVMGTIVSTPGWAQAGSPDPTAPPDPEHMAAWAEFVRQLAVEFPDVDAWAVWNEPNCDAHFRGSRAEYHALFRHAAREIRAGSPGARMVGPDLAYALGDGICTEHGAPGPATRDDYLDWLADFLRAEGHATDAVTVHMYGDGALIGGHLGTGDFEDLVRSRLGGAADAWRWPVWLTEVGLGTGAGNPIPHDAMESNLRQVYGAMLSRSAGSHWKKTFYWHLFAEGDADGRSGILSGYNQAVATRDPSHYRTKAAWGALHELAAPVRYRVNVRGSGWRPQTYDGQVAGTTGGGPLTGVRIALDDLPPQISVGYRVHLFRDGWQPEVSDGAVAGRLEDAHWLEAMSVRLVGAPPGTRVCYQPYVAHRGWQPEACDGAVAGTPGQQLAIEAIRVRIVR